MTWGMKARKTGYDDYGFLPEEIKRFKQWCKSSELASDERVLLLECALEVNDTIASDLYYTIVTGISWEKLDIRKYIGICKGSFYGYQRLVFARFRDRLRKIDKYPC